MKKLMFGFGVLTTGFLAQAVMFMKLDRSRQEAIRTMRCTKKIAKEVYERSNRIVDIANEIYRKESMKSEPKNYQTIGAMDKIASEGAANMGDCEFLIRHLSND